MILAGQYQLAYFVLTVLELWATIRRSDSVHRGKRVAVSSGTWRTTERWIRADHCSCFVVAASFTVVPILLHHLSSFGSWWWRMTKAPNIQRLALVSPLWLQRWAQLARYCQPRKKRHRHEQSSYFIWLFGCPAPFGAAKQRGQLNQAHQLKWHAWRGKLPANVACHEEIDTVRNVGVARKSLVTVPVYPW